MLGHKERYSVLFKAMAGALVCLFLLNDLAWAIPQDRSSFQQATLAPESRLNPFYSANKIEFAYQAASTMSAMKLNKIIRTGKFRQGEIAGEIQSLNQSFEERKINFKIDNVIQNGNFKCSGREYRYAIFHFGKGRREQVYFLGDHGTLTDEELRELRIIKRDEAGNEINERYHLACPGLEGVWFVDPDKESAHGRASARRGGPADLPGQPPQRVAANTAADVGGDRVSLDAAMQDNGLPRSPWQTRSARSGARFSQAPRPGIRPNFEEIQHCIDILVNPASQKFPRYDAVIKLRHFGPDAKIAIPALIDTLRTKEEDICYQAQTTLEEIGSVSIPALM